MGYPAAIVVEAKQATIKPLKQLLFLPTTSLTLVAFASCGSGMASDRGEVETSRAFRSVKEAVAVFGERIQFRPSGGAHGGHRVATATNPRANAATAPATDVKLERSDGVRASDFRPRESHSKPIFTYNANKLEGSSGDSKSAVNLLPVPVPVPRTVSEDVPMYLVPSSPPFFASSPSLANDDDDDYQERKRKEADLIAMRSIKKLEEEAARARQDVSQLKRRLAEMELSMATLNAKLHRALSKVAHMEADNAAAARASIERGRGGDMAALTVWAERRAPSRPQLGQLLRLGDADREVVVAGGGGRVVAPARRKAQKQKPIVPLVIPLIHGVLFSQKSRTKDKESMYMKELYSLLRLS